jgi:hypothetical protein
MSRACSSIFFVLRANACEVSGEFATEQIWKERDTVLAAFAGSDDDLTGVEVDAFDPKLCAFEQTQARAVEQRAHEFVNAV